MRQLLRRSVLPLVFALGLALPAQAKDLLYLNGLGGTYVLDPETLQTLQILKTKGFAQGFATSADKKLLYLATAQRELIEVFDRSTGKHVKTLSFSRPGEIKARIYAMTVSGNHLYAYLMSTTYSGWEAGKRDKMTMVPEFVAMDLRTEKVVGRTKAPYGIQSLRLVDGGSKIYALGRDGYEIDPKTWKYRLIYNMTDPAMENEGPMTVVSYWVHAESSGVSAFPYYAPDPITHRYATGLMTLDEATGKLEHFEFGPPVGNQVGFAAAMAPDRQRAYVTMNKFFEIDMQTKRLKRMKDYRTTFYAVNVSKDGKTIYLSSSGATLSEVDAETLEVRRSITMPNEVWDIHLLPAEGGPSLAADGQPSVHIAPAAMPR